MRGADPARAAALSALLCHIGGLYWTPAGRLAGNTLSAWLHTEKLIEGESEFRTSS
jgi:hypothetical protein